MTTHFAGKFKGNGCTVNLCKQWALRPICGMTTTDKSQVTCKACAKKLGVTPASAVETSKNETNQRRQPVMFDGAGLQVFKHKILQCRFRRADDRRYFALLGLTISKRTDEDDVLEERCCSDGVYARDMVVWEGLAAGYRCVRCYSAQGPMIGRSNTAYFEQILNWRLLCGDCWVQDDGFWQEQWDEYRSGVL